MRFEFNDCLLDRDRRELVRGSDPIAVGPQVFDLLVHLLENREKVVSKDDLLDAVWNGRIVSESTLTSHINAARKAIGDTGRDQRLIRTIARKGFRFVGDVVAPDPDAAMLEPGPAAAAYPTDLQPPADRPSICVLPFLNLSGDPAEDYFVDGVVEDIITAFSRNRWLFVIARNSSFAYKGRSVDVRQAGRELGVRYVLEGSVRKAGERVRITGQLVDAATGRHLWAERFEAPLDDIFALQDQVAEAVSGALAPQLERAEIERAKRTPTESMHAYDYYLRGMAHQYRGDRQATADALALFGKAMELDPNFASAHAMAAWCLFWRKVNGWLVDPVAETAEGVRLSRLALDLGRDDAVAMTRAGHVLGHLAGDLHSGIAWLDRAVVLNPNLAAAWFLGGFLRTWVGESDSAIRHFERAMRLSPLDPELYRMQGGMAAAHLFAGRYDAATEWAEKSFRDLPSFLLSAGVMAAGHALSGRIEQARPAIGHLRALDPSLRCSTLCDWLPIQREQDREMLAEGLRRAGLPE